MIGYTVVMYDDENLAGPSSSSSPSSPAPLMSWSTAADGVLDLSNKNPALLTSDAHGKIPALVDDSGSSSSSSRVSARGQTHEAPYQHHPQQQTSFGTLNTYVKYGCSNQLSAIDGHFLVTSAQDATPSRSNLNVLGTHGQQAGSSYSDFNSAKEAGPSRSTLNFLAIGAQQAQTSIGGEDSQPSLTHSNWNFLGISGSLQARTSRSDFNISAISPTETGTSPLSNLNMLEAIQGPQKQQSEDAVLDNHQPFGLGQNCAERQAYLERRRRNNEAAKRSRDAKRQREIAIRQRLDILEQQNQMLRNQLAKCRCSISSNSSPNSDSEQIMYSDKTAYYYTNPNPNPTNKNPNHTTNNTSSNNNNNILFIVPPKRHNQIII